MILDIRRSKPIFCSILATACIFTLASGCSSSKKESAEESGENADAIVADPNATAGTDPLPVADAVTPDLKKSVPPLTTAVTTSTKSSGKRQFPPKSRRSTSPSSRHGQNQPQSKTPPAIAQASITPSSHANASPQNSVSPPVTQPTPLSAPPPTNQALNNPAVAPTRDEQQVARAPASPRNAELPQENETITAESENGIASTLLANRTAMAAALGLAALGGGGFAFWKRRRVLG